MISSKIYPLNNNEENIEEKENEEKERCLICNNELNIHNSVTPLCKHTHCYECFWKWAEKNDNCPFCRKKLIPRNRQKELEMTNLIERINEIRLSLEDLYNDYDIKKAHLITINKKIKILHNQKKNIELLIGELEYKYGYIDKKIKYKFKFFNKLKSWNNNPQFAIIYFEKMYKRKLILKLKLCFEEIKYNIKYKNCKFWKNLNKKWDGDFHLGNSKFNNDFKKIFSNFHIYRKLKTKSYFKRNYSVLPSASSFSNSYNLENLEDDDFNDNLVVEI